VKAGSYPLTLQAVAGTTDCETDVMETFSDHCPPSVHCNPPPPRHQKMTLPCPK